MSKRNRALRDKIAKQRAQDRVKLEAGHLRAIGSLMKLGHRVLSQEQLGCMHLRRDLGISKEQVADLVAEQYIVRETWGWTLSRKGRMAYMERGLHL